MAKKSTSPSKTKTASKAKKASGKAPTKRNSGGPSAPTRILQAIASLRVFGEQADRKTVQGIVAMTSAGSFATTLLNMKKKGLVDYDSTTVWLTEAGLAEVGDAVIPVSNDGIQEKLKETIKVKKSHEIFDLLTDGNAYTKQELADKMSMENNSSFGTYMSALSKVSEKIDGKTRLKDIAFPCGRPCEK